MRQWLRRTWAGIETPLLAVAPAAFWIPAAAIAAVLAWGLADPFGLRQRLDWMVTAQFFRHRTPPPLDPGLLQVSIDDEAAAEFEFPLPHHIYAGALRQLAALGARSIMIDVFFKNAQDRLVEDPEHDFLALS